MQKDQKLTFVSGTHVDDIGFGVKDTPLRDETIAAITKRYGVDEIQVLRVPGASVKSLSEIEKPVDSMRFLGTVLRPQSEKLLTIDQVDYISTMKDAEWTAPIRPTDKAGVVDGGIRKTRQLTEEESEQQSKRAGTLGWLALRTRPDLSFITGEMKRVSNSMVGSAESLSLYNKAVRMARMYKNEYKIHIHKLKTPLRILGIGDASEKGQGGYMIFLVSEHDIREKTPDGEWGDFKTDVDLKIKANLLHWRSYDVKLTGKEKEMAGTGKSSQVIELIVLYDMSDAAYRIFQQASEIMETRHPILATDSGTLKKNLISEVIRLKEWRYQRLLENLRQQKEFGEVEEFFHTPGKTNVTDPLTKVTWSKSLHELMTTGHLMIRITLNPDGTR